MYFATITSYKVYSIQQCVKIQRVMVTKLKATKTQRKK